MPRHGCKMRYVGSKRKVVKHILPLMMANRGDRTWVEPFVGGGNVIEHVTGNRIGADINIHVIQALMLIRDHVHKLPKNNSEFTEYDYELLRSNDIDHRKIKSFAGFAYSFGSLWMDSWARNSENRDYVKAAYNLAVEQNQRFKGAVFVCSTYERLYIPDKSIIYCDPPYSKTKRYRYSCGKVNEFDHSKFWQWCRKMREKDHLIFISEYNAPDDFKCIWEKEILVTIAKESNSTKRIERLFTL